MTHADAQFDKELAAAYEELEEAQQKLADLRRRLPHEPVSDYELQGADGPVSLSALVRREGGPDPGPQHGLRLLLLHDVGRQFQRCRPPFAGPRRLRARLCRQPIGTAGVRARTRLALPHLLGGRLDLHRRDGFPEPGRRLHVRLPARGLGLPQERRRQHHARGQRPLRSRATPTAAPGTCSICSPTAGTAGTRNSTTRRKTDHRERQGGAVPATRPLLFTRSIYTPVLWPGAGRPGKESGTSGAWAPTCFRVLCASLNARVSTTNASGPSRVPRNRSRLARCSTVRLPLLASSSIRVEGTSSQSKPRRPNTSRGSQTITLLSSTVQPAVASPSLLA